MDEKNQSENIDIVIFGGTGDLSLRKLFPALYQMEDTRFFSGNIRIFGASRKKYTNELFHNLLKNSCKRFISNINNKTWIRFCKKIQYVQISAENEENFQELYSFINKKINTRQTQ
jgi:glucose-6-phosphate 1-dehydrogenase